jgi:hypothetical protein
VNVDFVDEQFLIEALFDFSSRRYSTGRMLMTRP